MGHANQYIHEAWSHAHQCWVKLFTMLTKLMYNKTKEKKETRWQWIHAHQSRSTAYTSCRVPRSLFKTAWLCWMYQLSSIQCVWCAGDGEAPQTGWGPLHVQSWIHALPKRAFGRPHSLVHGGVHWHAAWGSFQSGRCTHLSTPHKGWSTPLLCVLRLGLGPSGIPASGGEFVVVEWERVRQSLCRVDPLGVKWCS